MNEDTCSKKNEVTENYVRDIKNGRWLNRNCLYKYKQTVYWDRIG